METLHKGYTLKIYDGCFPLSTDSMVLADFVKLPRNARVLDLGAGCGTLGLLLCAKRDDCHITGLELDVTAHEGAVENIVRNELSGRMQSICGDLRNIKALLPAGQMEACVSNPPYFTGGPASQGHPTARRTDTCTSQELFSAAAWALKYGGDFFLVHRPEAMGQLIACAAEAGLEAKHLCLVRHKPCEPVSLVLLRFRKGAKPGLLWEELCLHHSNGTPTQDYNRIYHQ